MRVEPFFFAVLLTLGQAAQGATTEHFLEHDGVKRRYVVYVPAAKEGSATPLAVVLNFHGGGGRAEGQMRSTGMNAVAERHGFIAVYPDGTSAAGPFLTWNAGRCCAYAARRKVDDVGFVRRLVAELGRSYKIDAARIYAVGHSNGGMLAYRLAAEASDLLAGAGIVSADLGIDGPPPKRPVPLIVFHGLKDRNVLWEGGMGPNQIDREPHRAIPETLRIWKAWNGCAPQPVKTETAADYVMERYEPPPGAAGAPIVLYKLPGGGHAWPGGTAVSSRLDLGPIVHSVDASELIWRFFESL